MDSETIKTKIFNSPLKRRSNWFELKSRWLDPGPSTTGHTRNVLEGHSDT